MSDDKRHDDVTNCVTHATFQQLLVESRSLLRRKDLPPEILVHIREAHRKLLAAYTLFRGGQVS